MPLRHVLLSVLFAAGMVAVLAVTLDALESARRALPLATAAGLEQDWRLFAPDPPRSGMRLHAVVTWSDGAHTLWRVPASGALVGAYSDYRWRKWAEHAGADGAGARLWRPLVRYVARRGPRRAAATPVEVAIVRSTRRLPPPGRSAALPWSSVVIYRARVAPERR